MLLPSAIYAVVVRLPPRQPHPEYWRRESCALHVTTGLNARQEESTNGRCVVVGEARRVARVKLESCLGRARAGAQDVAMRCMMETEAVETSRHLRQLRSAQLRRCYLDWDAVRACVECRWRFFRGGVAFYGQATVQYVG